MLSRRGFLQGVGAAGLALATMPSRAPTTHAQTLAYDPTRRYPVQVSDVEYLHIGDEAFMARVYQPQGPGPFPGLLYIHGGQWVVGDRVGTAMDANPLAASGVVVFAPDFRNGSDAHPYPAAVADVNYATRWFKAHARDFSASPDRVGGAGSSSGGHLVMLSAMRPHDPRYAALALPEAPGVDASLAYLILVWPILDPLGRFIFAQETGREDILRSTRTFFQPWETVWEGNPTTLLERGEAAELSPTLIVQGTADTNVTPALQERFALAYRAAGGSVDLEIFPEQPHLFTRQPGPGTDRAHELMRQFIARQLAERGGPR
jgi:acetyl esterase